MMSHINKVFVQASEHWPKGTVVTASWLEHHKITDPRPYIRMGLIKKVSYGYYIKEEDLITWEGALYPLQTLLNLPLHVGGLSSLAYADITINDINDQKVYIFAKINQMLPVWFVKLPCAKNIVQVNTGLFKSNVGVVDCFINGIELKVSSPERAVFELIHCINKYTSFKKVDLVFKQLSNLDPLLIQQLLEECQIYKVKRLFLFLGEKHKLPWFNHIILDHIDLGSALLTLKKGGRYIKQYRIIVPKQLTEGVDGYLLTSERKKYPKQPKE